MQELFCFKADFDTVQRMWMVGIRFLGLDVILGAYGYANDWVLFALRIPNGPGISIQVGPLLIGIGRYL